MSRLSLKIKRKKPLGSRNKARISPKISMRRKRFASMPINVSDLPLKLSCNLFNPQEISWKARAAPLALKKSKVPFRRASENLSIQLRAKTCLSSSLRRRVGLRLASFASVWTKTSKLAPMS